MNELIRKIWEHRGYSDAWLKEINTCPHALPAHIPEMCGALKKYHDSKAQIVLLTDFDMDGIMTGVIGYAGLKELGFQVVLYEPDTGTYGITPAEIDDLAQRYPEAACILTGDVGITEYDSVAHAVELGLHVLITDHHTPRSQDLPGADVCVDPMCDRGPDAFGQICGAHVLYLVLREYARLYEGEVSAALQRIRRLRVFAGIGTVSDGMPLWYENRALVRDAVALCRQLFDGGLQRVEQEIRGCQTYRNAFIGLSVMLQKFAEQGKIKDSASIHEDFFSYYAAPAFNSIKRLHQNVGLAYQVFFGGPDAAWQAMDQILKLNEKRKAVVGKALSVMLDEKTDQPWAPYIYLTDEIPGIRGLLAQNMMEKTGEPVLVVAKNEDGTYSGSGRSPEWFPFLTQTADLACVHPAGHESAFGVTIEDDKACQALCEVLREKIRKEKPAGTEAGPDLLISTCDPDADTGIDLQLFREFLEEIDAWRPFGVGFPEPEEELEFCPGDGSWYYMGKEDQHVRVYLDHLQLVCFNQGPYFPDTIEKSRMPEVTRVRGKLDLNVFHGNSTVQFKGTLGPDMDQSGQSGNGEVDTR